MKRVFFTLLAVAALVLYASIPAQAAVPEQAQWTTVGHVGITNELGQTFELPLLQPANGVADQLRVFNDCPWGHSCAWIDANGGGAMLDIVWSIVYGHCNSLNPGWVNDISSARTGFGSGYGLNWYQAANCTNGPKSQPANTTINFTSIWNDSIRSFWVNCCS